LTGQKAGFLPHNHDGSFPSAWSAYEPMARGFFVPSPGPNPVLSTPTNCTLHIPPRRSDAPLCSRGQRKNFGATRLLFLFFPLLRLPNLIDGLPPSVDCFTPPLRLPLPGALAFCMGRAHPPTFIFGEPRWLIVLCFHYQYSFLSHFPETRSC